MEPIHSHNDSGGNSPGLEQNGKADSVRREEHASTKLRIQVPDNGNGSSKETAEFLRTAGPSASSNKTDGFGFDGGFEKATTVKFSSHSAQNNVGLSKLKRLFPHPKFAWISNNFDATRIKPIIRAAVAAWISVVLMVIPSTEKLMGQASFLIIIAAFLSPPAEPFIAVLERELAILIFTTTSFAWSCLGIRLAELARSNFNTSATTAEVFSGQYIEAWPTVICGIFLFIGTSILLYTRARVGPGPYVIGLILSCIVIDISLTVAPLYPYPFYQTGQSILKPIAFHSAIALLCSIFVFPETVNAQFIKRFRGVFVPLSKAMRIQPEIFAVSAWSDEFDPSAFINQVAAAEAALAPLAAASRLLKKDLSWGRFGSKDFSRLHELARRMAVRANGMAFYFKIIDPVVGKQVGTFSVLNTPMSSPAQSRAPTRPPSPNLSQIEVNSPSNVSISSTRPRNRHRHHSAHHSIHNSLYQHTLNFYHSHHHHHHHHVPSVFTHPTSLFHEVLSRSTENAVGVFESQRFLNLELRMAHPNADELVP
ncbi:hypothetical protein M0805_008881, partial [Coniferiporia weirii]